MNKRIFSVLFLLICFGTTTVFANTATIQVTGENRYKAVRLTPEIYNNANSDLSDILVKNSNGETIPYFINSGFLMMNENLETFKMELINSYIKDENFYFDYKVTDQLERDIVANSIDVSTDDRNFAKVIEVYGSYDNVYWEFVQSDKLYSIDDKSKLSIDFNKPQKYCYYRFKLSNNLEKISFYDVKLVYNVKESEINYFIESLTPTYSIEEKDKTTYIHIKGLKNLRLCEIVIKTDTVFKRTANAPDTSKEIYNLTLNEMSYSDTTLPLNGQLNMDEDYIITIDNNDDKPIAIKGLDVLYYADEVVFEANKNEHYTLEFGADESKTAPIYDITKYKDEILKKSLDKATINIINYDNEEEKQEEGDYKTVFNVVVIVITILLGVLILIRLRRIE